VNVQRADTKALADAHGVDIEMKLMDESRAAELIAGVTDGDAVEIIEVFNELARKRNEILQEVLDTRSTGTSCDGRRRSCTPTTPAPGMSNSKTLVYQIVPARTSPKMLTMSGMSRKRSRSPTKGRIMWDPRRAPPMNRRGHFAAVRYQKRIKHASGPTGHRNSNHPLQNALRA